MSPSAQLTSARDFGYALRTARKERNITQATLAQLAGVSERWLSNLESGKAPRAEITKIVQVAHALGLTFTLEPEKAIQLTPEETHITEIVKAQSAAATARIMDIVKKQTEQSHD